MSLSSPLRTRPRRPLREDFEPDLRPTTVDEDVPPVCVIISSFRPLIGGAERVTERVFAELHRRGIVVDVLTRRRPGFPSSVTISGINVRRLGHPSRTKLGALTFALHALCLLAWRLRRHRVLHVQNPDAPLLVAFVAKVLLRRRVVLTMHGIPAFFFPERSLERRLRLRLAGRLVDVIGVQSRWMGDELVARGVPRERIRLLPNGVDTAVFAPPSPEARRRSRALLGIPGSATVYLYVGRLVSLKGVDVLLEAWAMLPAVARGRLLIVGDGPDRESLEASALRSRLDDIRFEGAVDDVLAYLHAADVFVLPSRMEALSSALLEAMATGLAVLVSDLPANRTIVRDGHNGLTFTADDPADLARRMAELGSAERRAELGSRAVETIVADYSLDSVAERHRRLYREIVSRTSGPRGVR